MLEPGPYLCSPGSMFPTNVMDRIRIRDRLRVRIRVWVRLSVRDKFRVKGKNHPFSI